MWGLILAGLLAGGGGQGLPLPERTLVLLAEQGRLFIADPGPGIVPDGEEHTQHRYSFYYQVSADSPSISMMLVEADCKTEGRWRIRAGTKLTPTTQALVGQTEQHTTRRSSGWTQEPEQPPDSDDLMDHLGRAVWENTCLGTPSFGAIGELDPWAAAVLWKIKQHQGEEHRGEKTPTDQQN